MIIMIRMILIIVVDSNDDNDMNNKINRMVMIMKIIKVAMIATTKRKRLWKRQATTEESETAKVDVKCDFNQCPLAFLAIFTLSGFAPVRAQVKKRDQHAISRTGKRTGKQNAWQTEAGLKRMHRQTQTQSC